MDYGRPLAAAMGIQFIPFDFERKGVPVSATMIRDNPRKHWDYLAPAARPYYLTRVALVGAESTGKSTLAIFLARHFGSVCVPEYAEALLRANGGEFSTEMVPVIMHGQLASERALAPLASRWLFCDSDLITTLVWSEMVLGAAPEKLHQAAQAQKYAMTLLLDCTPPWVPDVHRRIVEAGARERFHARFEYYLEAFGRPYKVISGETFTERELAAVAVIESICPEVPSRK